MLKVKLDTVSSSGDIIDLFAEDDFEPKCITVTDAVVAVDGVKTFEEFKANEAATIPPSPPDTTQTVKACDKTKSNGIVGHEKVNSSNFEVLVGKLPWWTTDQHMYDKLHSIGVMDCFDVKFYEDRSNGQSKGYCILKVGSGTSIRTIHEKLPKIEIHGKFPSVVRPTQKALDHFEAQSRTRARAPQWKASGEVQEYAGMMGPRIPMGPGPPQMGCGPRMRMPMWGPKNMVPPFHFPPPGHNSSQRSPIGFQNVRRPQRHPPMDYDEPTMGMTIHRRRPISDGHMMDDRAQLLRNDWISPLIPQMRPICPAPPRLNPIFSECTWSQCPPNLGPPPSSSICTAPEVRPNYGHHTLGDHHVNPTEMNEFEFDQAINQNRTVSSSAIFRAIDDASNGDFPSAIETLVTAISIIRQSKVGDEEPCKILISSLQATLIGIESKSYGRSRTRSRSRCRSLSRERRDRHNSGSESSDIHSRGRREYREKNRDRNEENCRVTSRTWERENRDATARDRLVTRSSESRHPDTIDSYHRDRDGRDGRREHSKMTLAYINI